LVLSTVIVLGTVIRSPAQSATLKVSPESHLTQGQTATITYSDPSRAGQTIAVAIDDGGTEQPEVFVLFIELDPQGRGSATWEVPEWDSAVFNAPGAAEVIRPVLRGADRSAAELGTELAIEPNAEVLPQLGTGIRRIA
jgi:hypothetical protein